MADAAPSAVTGSSTADAAAPTAGQSAAAGPSTASATAGSTYAAGHGTATTAAGPSTSGTKAGSSYAVGHGTAVTAGGISKRSKAAAGRKFQRELRTMMFGFGDDANPLPQSVALVEDLVVDYLQRVLHGAADACEERNRHTKRGVEAPRVKERDVLFVLRKDKRRLQRAQELLEVYEEQKDAKKEYAKDHDEYARDEQ